MNAFEAFRPQQMLRLIEKFSTDDLSGQIKSFFSTDTVENDVYEWDEIKYDRTLAPVTGADAASTRMARLSKTKREHGIAHIRLSTFIDGRRLFIQERAAGELRPNAMLTLARELRNLRMKIDRTIAYMCAQALQGSLTVDSTTIPGSSVNFTVNFPGVGTFTRSADWSVTTTKIFSEDIHSEKRNYLRQSGFPLRKMIFNQTVGKQLLQNDEAKSWLQATQRGVQIFEAGVLGNAVGIEFQEYEGYYDDGSNLKSFIPDNTVIFTTDQNTLKNYLILAEGYGLIPRQAIGADPNSMVTRAPSAGYYTYSEVVSDPVGLKVVLGWSGLPIVSFPELLTVGVTA